MLAKAAYALQTATRAAEAAAHNAARAAEQLQIARNNRR
jgi:hypothetical protein